MKILCFLSSEKTSYSPLFPSPRLLKHTKERVFPVRKCSSNHPPPPPNPSFLLFISNGMCLFVETNFVRNRRSRFCPFRFLISTCAASLPPPVVVDESSFSNLFELHPVTAVSSDFDTPFLYPHTSSSLLQRADHVRPKSRPSKR